MPENKNTDTVVVLGAGVIGLTTAVLFLEHGFNVTILAEHFPGSVSPYYTSTWAGAHWRSFADNTDQESMENDRDTFFKFLELCKTEDESLIKLYRSFEYWDQKPINYQDPWFKGVIPKFKEVEVSDLPKGVGFGIEYEAMCINAPIYIFWLKKRAEKLGGVFLERKINNIDECYLVSGSCITINCSGLGSKNLCGVEDKRLFPTRGQTILIDAPHVNCNVVKHLNNEIVYVIPRGDGTVVLGGTLEPNNVSIEPDVKTADTILERCQELIGGLGEYSIIRHSVGFRPTREGGVRIETEERVVDGGIYHVCHHYGHGGFGFQSSWGAADRVFQKIQGLLLDKRIK